MKEKKYQGFTLIELLAVIVILTVIALIATPLIMNVINDAKKGAARDAGYNVIKAGELKAATEGIVGGNPPFHYNENSNLDMKGTKPTKFTLDINEDMDTELKAWLNGYCVIKNYGNETVTIDESKKTEEDCVNSIPETNATCFDTKRVAILDDVVISETKCKELFHKEGENDEELINTLCSNEPSDSGELTLADVVKLVSLTDFDTAEPELNLMIEKQVLSVGKIDDNYYSISGYHWENQSCSSDVVIPKKINNKQVIGIGERAFHVADNGKKEKTSFYVTSLKLPSSIKIVDSEGLANNQITDELNLSNLDDIKGIGYNAFNPNNLALHNQYNMVYLPNQEINYLSSVGFWNAFGKLDYVKIKKGNLNPDDIVRNYNEKYGTSHEKFGEKVEETDKYVKYQYIQIPS